MPEISSEELSDIKEQLAIIRTTGENTLVECRKTNGRVTKLEDSHNELKVDLAVLGATVNEKIKVLDRDVEGILPKVEKNDGLLSSIRGNWQAICVIALVVITVLDLYSKFMK